MSKWVVVAIDWGAPNVLAEFSNESDAQDAAERLDKLSLRATAVPDGHPLIRRVENTDE